MREPGPRWNLLERHRQPLLHKDPLVRGPVLAHREPAPHPEPELVRVLQPLEHQLPSWHKDLLERPPALALAQPPVPGRA